MKIGFIIFGAFEMLAIHYGIGATTLQAGYDMTKAAKVSGGSNVQSATVDQS